MVKGGWITEFSLQVVI